MHITLNELSGKLGVLFLKFVKKILYGYVNPLGVCQRVFTLDLTFFRVDIAVIMLKIFYFKKG
jgi:hypothetical protein